MKKERSDIMNTNQIYVGTIKKCGNVYLYKKYGEERYAGDFTIGHTEYGHIESYTDIINNQAILIKIDINKYVWLKQINTVKDQFLTNIGLPVKVINASPEHDNDLFVDENSLIPYFSNEESKNISVGKLKKKVLIDPRIKTGIEN